MATLSQTVGQDVPTFDEVRTKIEAQYAKALGTAELSSRSRSRMLEIEAGSQCRRKLTTGWTRCGTR